MKQAEPVRLAVATPPAPPSTPAPEPAPVTVEAMLQRAIALESEGRNKEAARLLAQAVREGNGQAAGQAAKRLGDLLQKGAPGLPRDYGEALRYYEIARLNGVEVTFAKAASRRMDRNARIFVAGHRGLVGSALVRCLERGGYTNILKRSRAELDLEDPLAVRKFFDEERPEYVMLAAAKVGGILANETYPAEFIHSNLVVQTNVIHECWRHDVKRLLFLGSSCVYPRACPQPIREDYLLTSELEPTNRAYALAKIAGIEMCASYNRQYGTQYLAAMPTNLYGPGDNYDLASSHVLPALIRKCHEARLGGARELALWGSGSPRREFLHSDDMAEACVFLMSMPDEAFARIAVGSPGFPLVNIGAGADQTIAELARPRRRGGGLPGRLRLGPQQARRHAAQAPVERAPVRARLAAEARPAPGNPADLRGISFLPCGARLNLPIAAPASPRSPSPARRCGSCRRRALQRSGARRCPCAR